ncbi:MAG: hypothetical protein VKJ09_15770, partial [Leptolyngbya sp.]|nr:hypothetical protein [Leptolyngbya sp.]
MSVTDHQRDLIASSFVAARRTGGVVSSYPGEVPQSLAEAYAVQDAAIRLWPDALAGWKVGGISADWRERAGADRLVGPVFSRQVHIDRGELTDMPVFDHGFAAVEGEVTAVIGQDVPESKTSFSLEEAKDFISSLHVGIEIASSPFPEINDHGPLVTITDFGNNMGLIIGEQILGWQDFNLVEWVFETWIDGALIGRGVPTGL